jgi:hypothetical protein
MDDETLEQLSDEALEQYIDELHAKLREPGRELDDAVQTFCGQLDDMGEDARRVVIGWLVERYLGVDLLGWLPFIESE